MNTGGDPCNRDDELHKKDHMIERMGYEHAVALRKKDHMISSMGHEHAAALYSRDCTIKRLTRSIEMLKVEHMEQLTTRASAVNNGN